MTPHAGKFVGYLETLYENDRGAIARLRHSLAQPIGEDPKAVAIVERFAGMERDVGDPYRLALYLIAALYAHHPEQSGTTLAQAFGTLWRTRQNPSIEQRFVTLLQADEQQIAVRLRQAITLLAADGYGFDYVQLIADVALWFDPLKREDRWQAMRQRWGREFYGAAFAGQAIQSEPEGVKQHLLALAKDESPVLARLRRSLTLPPGEDPAVFPSVEPFIDPAWKSGDPRRRARYLVAGLFATHSAYEPGCTLASALNRLAAQNKDDGQSVERRFIAVLGASADTIADHLRQAVALLRDTQIGYDPALLIKDMEVWLARTPNVACLDGRRQRWARDFYWIPRSDEHDNQSETTQEQGA
ncbi:CRISPR-associated protein Cse2 [Salinisphaera shabanensis E1L3A]|uniref:CRISPR-associated protein Cse2 n=1 Tax=Salinisphaera shabanensis E1L3A TaxID=1033802 RepID=F7QBQ6_9GAMM|nr:type I-E CRISPR-associated protein Cse2/CasB [Salinisphaera shabanensis]ERJ17421.1 CRISPR-associated protein Cse2 [Salinisphaera shabanensis E1L3A]